MKPTGELLLLPFSYPYYPREVVEAQVHAAALNRLRDSWLGLIGYPALLRT